MDRIGRDNVTIREACGNTVRNITAADQAGIDPDEPFDVTPYAHAMFEYFCASLFVRDGRKFKIAFSSSEKTRLLFSCMILVLFLAFVKWMEKFNVGSK
jgi:sulfite reductase (ferredoxin)